MFSVTNLHPVSSTTELYCCNTCKIWFASLLVKYAKSFMQNDIIWVAAFVASEPVSVGSSHAMAPYKHELWLLNCVLLTSPLPFSAEDVHDLQTNSQTLIFQITFQIFTLHQSIEKEKEKLLPCLGKVYIWRYRKGFQKWFPTHAVTPTWESWHF